MRRMIRAAAKPVTRVLGIDASLTSTGYAFRDLFSGELITGRVDPGTLRGPARLFYVRRKVESIVLLSGCSLVVYEDYAMGAGKSGMTFNIGELGGVLKTLFWENQIDVMLVAPTALKKAITGRGNADGKRTVNGRKFKDKTKPEMRAALINTFGIDLNQNDEADACGLMLMGEMRYGSNTVTKAQQSTLRLDALAECSIIQGRANGLKLIAK